MKYTTIPVRYETKNLLDSIKNLTGLTYDDFLRGIFLAPVYPEEDFVAVAGQEQKHIMKFDYQGWVTDVTISYDARAVNRRVLYRIFFKGTTPIIPLSGQYVRCNYEGKIRFALNRFVKKEDYLAIYTKNEGRHDHEFHIRYEVFRL